MGEKQRGLQLLPTVAWSPRELVPTSDSVRNETKGPLGCLLRALRDLVLFVGFLGLWPRDFILSWLSLLLSFILSHTFLGPLPSHFIFLYIIILIF